MDFPKENLWRTKNFQRSRATTKKDMGCGKTKDPVRILIFIKSISPTDINLASRLGGEPVVMVFETHWPYAENRPVMKPAIKQQIPCKVTNHRGFLATDFSIDPMLESCRPGNLQRVFCIFATNHPFKNGQAKGV